MTRILMVCLGNICRSPLAEGILKSKLPKEHFYIDSAGTGAYHVGNKPDERSIAIAKKYGIDITHQKARQFSQKDFTEFDVIYAMDVSNYNSIIKLARTKEDKDKVSLILHEIEPTENLDVPDPYYGGVDGFQNIFNMLENACEAIKNKYL